MAEEFDEIELSTRPRLTREQVWLLENQFQIHHKPNSSIKRQLAERTGLSHQRVANWFQNRRAKAKQQKRQVEFEQAQSLEAERKQETPNVAAVTDVLDPASPAFYPTDFFFSDFDQTPRQPTLGNSMEQRLNTFVDTPFQPPQYESPAEASYASLSRSLALAAAAVAQGAYGENQSDVQIQDSDALMSYDVALDGPINLSIPPSAFSDWSGSRESSAIWTPSHQLDDPFEYHSLNITQNQQPHEESLSPIQQTFPDLPVNTLNAENPELLDTVPFPSQILTDQPLQMEPQREEHQQHQTLSLLQQPEPWNHHCIDDGEFINSANSSRRGSCSTEVKGAFNNPPAWSDTQKVPVTAAETAVSAPLNIAARRKRPRPAALGNAALRSTSYMGPMTVSPTSKGSFLGAPQSVRRVKSTGNNLNFGRGRIQKGAVGSAQRSPLNFETFADAGAFSAAEMSSMIRSTTTSSGSASVSGSLAPPTPLSPLDLAQMQSNISTPMPNDCSFMYSPDFTACFTPTSLDSPMNLLSPPMTPHYFKLQEPQSFPQPADYQANQHNEYTSAEHGFFEDSSPNQVTSFPPQLHMPQPTHVTPISCGDPDMASLLQHQSPPESAKEEKATPDTVTFISEYPQSLTSPQPNPGAMSATHKPKKYEFANQTADDFA